MDVQVSNDGTINIEMSLLDVVLFVLLILTVFSAGFTIGKKAHQPSIQDNAVNQNKSAQGLNPIVYWMLMMFVAMSL